MLKRTPLKRKTPLKAYTQLKAKTPLSAKKGLTSSSGLKSNSVSLKRTSIKVKPKKKVERTSIVFKNPYRCSLCGKHSDDLKGGIIEKHEIFFGTANRDKSIEDKMIAYLCPECHRGTNGVHNCKETDLKLKRIGQEVWESNYGTRDDFIKRFGQSWL